MKKLPVKNILAYLAFSVVMAVLSVDLSLSLGCSKKNRPTVPISTSVVIPASQLAGVNGDDAYAQVNSEWMTQFYGVWRQELFDKGVTKWEGRFDCNKFSGKLVNDAQIEYYAANFHSWTKGQALALAVIYYSPQASINKVRHGRKGIVGATVNGSYFAAEGATVTEWISPNHAIVEVETEKGRKWFEPQTGLYVTLTEEEQQTVYFRAR